MKNAKGLLYAALAKSGLAGRARRANPRRASVLLYHRVVPGELPAFCPNHGVEIPLSRFERHMEYLSLRCRVMPLDEMVERLSEGKSLPPHAVALTFDDGHRSDCEIVRPALERFGFPATFYVATGFLEEGFVPWWREIEAVVAASVRVDATLPGGGKRWDVRALRGKRAFFRHAAARARAMPMEERARLMAALRREAGAEGAPMPHGLFMTWEQIRAMARDERFRFGAHSVNHPNLALEAPDTARVEIERSKEALESRLGVPVTAFAYPYGDAGTFTDGVRGMVARAGFRHAVTTVPGHPSDGTPLDLMQIPRIAVDGYDDTDALEVKLSGAFRALKRIVRGAHEAWCAVWA